MMTEPTREQLSDELTQIEEWLDDHAGQKGEAHSNLDRLELLDNERKEAIKNANAMNRRFKELRDMAEILLNSVETVMKREGGMFLGAHTLRTIITGPDAASEVMHSALRTGVRPIRLPEKKQ
jgi:hypothetical protein